ncbi:MAG TPA: methylated-DNA--[protein]-cysteine S-methyltransferase [Sphingomicrobium sp.]
MIAADFTGSSRTLLTRSRPGVVFRQAAVPPSIADAFRRYRSGRPDALDEIMVAPDGTDFDQCVWLALRQIPAGATISYGALATSIGRPGAARAVGLANGRNPIPVIIPCHRVIGADGSLTGYGSGIARKEALLAHEGAWPRLTPLPFESNPR